MTAPLNPAVYSAMVRRFGPANVTVAHPGEPMAGEYVAVPSRPGRYRLGIAAWGESYLTDCPFCGDDRRRLSVSHRFGDRDTRTGDPNLHLWRCYNEDCQKDASNRDSLALMLTLTDGWVGGQAPKVVLPPVEVRPVGDLPAAPFPGEFVSLSELPPTARSRAYLETRRRPPFDAVALAAEWGLGEAVRMPPGMGWTEGRIAIPVTDRGVVVGWQYRLAVDLPKAEYKANPKYLTYYPKSAALYGLDRVPADAPVVAVVEGATDVWRYGPGAVARFGVKLSGVQVKKLVARAAGRTVVWVPDADDRRALAATQDDVAAVVRAGFRGRVGILGLTPGTDPAGYDGDALRKAVVEVADRASSV